MLDGIPKARLAFALIIIPSRDINLFPVDSAIGNCILLLSKVII